MIICVSAHPAIDHRLRLESIAPGEVNRAISARPLQFDYHGFKTGGGVR